MESNLIKRVGPCAVHCSFITNLLVGVLGVYQLSSDVMWIRLCTAILALLNVGLAVCQAKHMDFTLKDLQLQNSVALQNISKMMYTGLIQELRIQVARSAYQNTPENVLAVNKLDATSNPETFVSIKFDGVKYVGRAIDIVDELKSINLGPEPLSTI